MSSIDPELLRALGSAMVAEMLTWPAYKDAQPGDEGYPEPPLTLSDYTAFRGDHVASAALRLLSEKDGRIAGLYDEIRYAVD